MPSLLSRTAACASIALLTLGLFPQPAMAAAYDGHPKLVVVIVIDQFRGDYLDRYRADFKGNGFRLFLDKGAVFTGCYFDYANTKTAPGHSAIGTGAYSDGNGISDNEWWDLSRNTKRPVSSVEDDRYVTIADAQSCTAHDCGGASPRNLMASTIGDELRMATQGQAKLYGISLKDRAAILTAGASANGAFWIDHRSGHYITSSFYMNALPQWALDFNSGPAIQQAIDDSGVENVADFYQQVGETGAANAYELNFAKALIQGEQLGKHSVTDMLTISLSANDLAGHHFGPDSPQQKEMVDGLDADLDGFFAWLDKYLEGGLGNAIITLSADHGIAPTPKVAGALGLPAADVDLKALIADLNEMINAKFSPGEKITYVLPSQSLPFLSLDNTKFDRAGINEQEAEEAVRDALPAAMAKLAGAAPAQSAAQNPDQANAPASTPSAPSAPPPPTRFPAPPTLAHVYTRVQLAKGEYPYSEFGTLLAHSYSRNGGWYVMAILEAFQMEGADPAHTTHYSPYSYDRHVPLAFYGAAFAHGTYRGRVAPVDMAPTLASILGVNEPSSSVGHVLTQALRTPVYPSAEPKTARPLRRGRNAPAKAAPPESGAANPPAPEGDTPAAATPLPAPAKGPPAR